MLMGLAGCAPRPFSWAAYYGADLPPSALTAFDLVVLDPKYPYSVQSLKAEGKTVLAYVSLGEVGEFDPWFTEKREAGLLLNENATWKGSHTVDIRSPLWKDRVLNQIIPDIYSKGYRGLMLDTIDSPLEAERANPALYQGMKEAAIDLVLAIHRQYPDLILAQNRGYAILPQVAPALDYVIAESTFTHYDIAADQPRLNDAAIRDQSLALLRAGQAVSPGLKVLALEYWNPADTGQVKSLYKTIRNFGFYPYISTVRLNVVYPEP